MTEQKPSQPTAGDKSTKPARRGRQALSAAFNVLAVLSLAAAIFFAWMRFTNQQSEFIHPQQSSLPLAQRAPETNQQPLAALPVYTIMDVTDQGVTRRPDFLTLIPSRPRAEVITYTVQRGDNLFNIADSFGVKPETILWGNFDVLEDNPHLLKPDQVLNILPVNGVYYQWRDGDTLSGVAAQFKTTAASILEFTGNHLDLTLDVNSMSSITPGTWVVVPDGKRPIKDWGPPVITRSNPASARSYGDGYCSAVYEGAVGNGWFIWPTVAHNISGYNFTDLHPAIDIAGGEGAPVVAADNGVIVFAGWSNFGYGNLIVIDHGNGFQTAYAHLSSYGVGCGQSVFQGGLIGAVGNTGNSFGSHLHFELSYNGVKLNPLDYLP